jgi:hypothetical protein
MIMVMFSFELKSVCFNFQVIQLEKFITIRENKELVFLFCITTSSHQQTKNLISHLPPQNSGSILLLLLYLLLISLKILIL